MLPRSPLYSRYQDYFLGVERPGLSLGPTPLPPTPTQRKKLITSMSILLLPSALPLACYRATFTFTLTVITLPIAVSLIAVVLREYTQNIYGVFSVVSIL